MTREDLKELLVDGDYLRFQTRCVRQFGPAAGIMLRDFIHRTGRSHLEDSWFWKSREEGCEETGLGHREWDKAKRILLGKRPWAARTVKVLEERRPSRRSPAEYRVDLLAVAQILGVEVPAETADGLQESDDIADDDLEFLFEELIDDDPFESPRGTAESPYAAAE